jgi:hypothetical protein
MDSYLRITHLFEMLAESDRIYKANRWLRRSGIRLHRNRPASVRGDDATDNQSL